MKSYRFNTILPNIGIYQDILEQLYEQLYRVYNNEKV
jgi:hypothetical protein